MAAGFQLSSLLYRMDSIFRLGEAERSAYLQQMMQSFDCAYICLWSYYQPSNCLQALDGLYREQSNQPSSSAGSLAAQLFHAYKDRVNYVETGRIPGLAFKNNLPYMELQLHDLQMPASSRVQLQFYQEAGIKTVVFMGCARGEIELGISSHTQVNLETEMRNLFPIDFSREPNIDPTQPPSSSSSSLRSLSVDDSPPQYSPLLFNINPANTSLISDPLSEALNIGQIIAAGSTATTAATTAITTAIATAGGSVTTTIPQQQAIQALSQMRSVQLPSIETEDDAMIKAIVAVLSNPSSTQMLPPIITHNPTTAFKSYMGGGALVPRSTRKHNMFKRSVLFFRNLMNMRRRQELQIHQGGNRPTATQLHHMISERRRREKLNESFQMLRSLLPPGSKKDKASVLSNTTEYLSSLKSQVADLAKRNQMLESQLSSIRNAEATGGDDQIFAAGSSSSSSVERTNVEITQVASSTSESRFLDLRVSVRGECTMLDLVIRIMEFLRRQRNVSVMSIRSNTRMLESIPVHEITLGLKIEGQDFDESGFQEAVRRVVDDLPHH